VRVAKPRPDLSGAAFADEPEPSTLLRAAFGGNAGEVSRQDLEKDLQRRVAAALNIPPEAVNIEGYRTRYMSLFIQCWGRAAGGRIFAKIFIVDQYPIPARYATPGEELAAPQNPTRPVEEQITTEWDKYQQMRRLMGKQSIPALLAYSLSHRILVYQEVQGLRVDSLRKNWPMTLGRVGGRTRGALQAAVFKAGAWLRALHDSTAQGCESVQYERFVEDLRDLMNKNHIATSSHAALASRVLEAAHLDVGTRPLRVPVALNHGDFTLPNLLWNIDDQHLWVIDFELSSRRPILHDLCTMIFDLRKRLLHPLASPPEIAMCEKYFWAGYGGIPINLHAVVNALATSRLFYHVLPRLSYWRDERGWMAGMKALFYTRILEPFLTPRIIAMFSDT
jgi:hypothetical protein